MIENRKFWNWAQDADTGERTLYLCGVIAQESWYADDVTPAMFKAELLAGEGDITVWINSVGGDVLAASQIYNMLKSYKGNVTVKIDSIAASAASVIAMAGTKVLISPTGFLFIHDPSSVAIGNTEEMRKAIQMLDEVKESILNAYELKTGLSRAKLSHLMSSETWLSAHMAIELGFADDLLFVGKDTGSALIADPITAENGYAYSCRTVSNQLLARIAEKLRKDVVNTAPGTAPPDPPAPTVLEETIPPAAPAAMPVESPDSQPRPAGVSVSGLERRLSLLRPYGVDTLTRSQKTAPTGTVHP